MMKQPECYVGYDPNTGTIRAAMVAEPKYPERTAITLAQWVLEGLIIKPASIKLVRKKLFLGDMSELPKRRFHIQIIISGEQEFKVETEGDDDLLDEYQDYERYGNEPDWFTEDEEEESSEVSSNQMPLF